MKRLRHIVLLVTAITLAAGVRASDSKPALAIPINLKCTTCDDFIRCASPGSADSVVYRLKEKTFWAQVATIGDYLTQFLYDKKADERPLALYRDAGGKRTIEHDPAWRAQIDVPAARITVLDHRIDQLQGAWTNSAGLVVGQCVAMPRRDGYRLVRVFLGKPALGSGGGTS